MLGSSRHILIVDDNEDNLLFLQLLLESEGYAVEVATCGYSALDRMRVSPPSLVLLDVMMPGITGFEVMQQVRQSEALRDLIIVLVSAHEDVNGARVREVGANDFIRKPVDCDELINKVNHWLSKSMMRQRWHDRQLSA